MKHTSLSLMPLALLGAVFFGWACSGEETSTLNEDGGSGPAGTGGTTTTGTATSSSTNVGGGFTTGTGGAVGQGGDCVNVPYQAEQVLRPADIIIVIDNSGSMTDEIAGVEQNINVNFAQIIGASNVDYQVIMVTDHGSGSLDVCVGPPLSNTANCSGAPGDVPGLFHHYDINVQSTDSVCIILDTLYGSNGGGEPDQQALHPEGWSKWLRSEAVKIFVEITDDKMGDSYTAACNINGQHIDDQNDNSPNANTSAAAAAATLFDQTLMGLAPAQFGSPATRNYIFHSIVGVTAKPMPAVPYEDFEGIVGSICNSPSVAYSTGPGYQWLSKGTGGLRFPVCNYQSYDAVFQEIADGVVEGASVPCEFNLPEPEEGQTIDPKTLVLDYTPGGNGTPETFEQVESAGACGANDAAFYIDNDKIILCPEACTKVSADMNAEVTVVAQCGTGPE